MSVSKTHKAYQAWVKLLPEGANVAQEIRRVDSRQGKKATPSADVLQKLPKGARAQFSQRYADAVQQLSDLARTQGSTVSQLAQHVTLAHLNSFAVVQDTSALRSKSPGSYLEYFCNHDTKGATAFFKKLYKDVPLAKGSASVLARFVSALGTMNGSKAPTVTLFRALDNKVELLQSANGKPFEIPYFFHADLAQKTAQQQKRVMLDRAKEHDHEAFSFVQAMTEHNGSSAHNASFFLSTTVDPHIVFDHIGSGKRIAVLKVSPERLNFAVDLESGSADSDAPWEGEIPLLFGTLPQEIVEVIDVDPTNAKSVAKATARMTSHLTPLDATFRAAIKSSATSRGWDEDDAVQLQKQLNRRVDFAKACKSLVATKKRAAKA